MSNLVCLLDVYCTENEMLIACLLCLSNLSLTLALQAVVMAMSMTDVHVLHKSFDKLSPFTSHLPAKCVMFKELFKVSFHNLASQHWKKYYKVVFRLYNPISKWNVFIHFILFTTIIWFLKNILWHSLPGHIPKFKMYTFALGESPQSKCVLEAALTMSLYGHDCQGKGSSETKKCA